MPAGGTTRGEAGRESAEVALIAAGTKPHLLGGDDGQQVGGGLDVPAARHADRADDARGCGRISIADKVFQGALSPFGSRSALDTTPVSTAIVASTRLYF